MLLQSALNHRLPLQPQLPQCFTDYRILSMRYSPEDWGYYWAPGAWKFRHNKPEVHKHPGSDTFHISPLKVDGIFGPKTEGALKAYQYRVGIAVTGLAGPETYNFLWPFWKAAVVMPEPQALILGGPPAQGPVAEGDRQKPTLGSPFDVKDLKLDNAEAQFARQMDQAGKKSTVIVVQFTYKSQNPPKEVVPGQWEHTGGVQVALRGINSNVQIYYQLTRAELVSIDDFIVPNLKLALVAPFVQPYAQLPLGSGSSADPNNPQIGINLGNTLSLEYQPAKGPVTLKLFAQGTVGVAVDNKGAGQPTAGVLGGVSVQVNTDEIAKVFGGGTKPSPRKGRLTVDSRQVIVRKGAPAKLLVTIADRPYAGSIQVDLRVLPKGVRATRGAIPSYRNNTEIYLELEDGAPAGSSNAVFAEAYFPGGFNATSDMFTVVAQP